MWSEICELIPLTTGLDCCIEHGIAEYQRCVNSNIEKGNDNLADFYQKQVNKLKHRKEILNNMNPIKRWFHCKMQFNKKIRKHEKAIREYKKRLRI